MAHPTQHKRLAQNFSSIELILILSRREKKNCVTLKLGVSSLYGLHWHLRHSVLTSCVRESERCFIFIYTHAYVTWNILFRIQKSVTLLSIFVLVLHLLILDFSVCCQFLRLLCACVHCTLFLRVLRLLQQKQKKCDKLIWFSRDQARCE